MSSTNPSGPSNVDELRQLLGSLQNKTREFRDGLEKQFQELAYLRADVAQIIVLSDHRIASNADRLGYNYQAQLKRMQQSEAGEKEETNKIRFEAFTEVEELKTELDGAFTEVEELKTELGRAKSQIRSLQSELYACQGSPSSNPVGSLSMLSLLPPQPSSSSSSSASSKPKPRSTSSRGRSSSRGGGGGVKSTRGGRKTASIPTVSSSSPPNALLPSVLSTMFLPS